MTVDFERLNWQDYPSHATPINAENLNRLEEGVAGLYSDFEALLADVESLPGRVSAAEGNISSIESDISTLNTTLNRGVLFFKNVSVSARTGDIATVRNSLITANHVVVSAVWGDSSKIITNVTWTTSARSLVLNGTCTGATTVDLILAEKKN